MRGPQADDGEKSGHWDTEREGRGCYGRRGEIGGQNTDRDVLGLGQGQRNGGLRMLRGEIRISQARERNGG